MARDWIVAAALISAGWMGCSSPPGPSTSPRTARSGLEACDTACPQGMRRAEVSLSEVIARGGFVFESASCEAVCVAEQPCQAPFVPVVTVQGDGHVFTCEALEGFAAIPSDDAVDFSGVAFEAPSCALPARPPDEIGAEHPSFEGQRVELMWLTVADVSGDGRLDLVTLLERDGRDIELVAWVQGDGFAFAPAALDSPRLQATLPVAATDRDGDGNDDLLVLQALSSPMTWRLALGRGDGALTLDPAALGEASGCDDEIEPKLLDRQQRFVDLDGDGALDLLFIEHICEDAYSDGPVAIKALMGVHGTQPPDAEVLAQGSRFYVANIDADPELEVMVLGPPPPEEGDFDPEYGTWRLLDRVDGRWTQRDDGVPALSGSNATRDNALTLLQGLDDIDGDGDVDLWGQLPTEANGPERFAVYRNDGAGRFDVEPVLSAIVPDAGGCAVSMAGDFNGDGRADVACQYRAQDTTNPNNTIDQLAVFSGQEGGQMTELTTLTFTVDLNRGAGIIADMDGDGLDDVVALRRNKVWIQRGYR